MQDYKTPSATHYSSFYESTQSPGSIFFLRPEQILVENVARRQQSQNKIIRLAAQIRRYGLSEPLTVRPLEEGSSFSRYILVEGEELWRAACLAEYSKIPCVLAPKLPQNSAEGRILAEIRGKTLHIFEQAAAIRLLIEEFHLTQEEIARRSGLSQSAVANKLRLLRLTQEEQRELLKAGLGERHARALLRVSGETRAQALSAMIREKLTVSAAEALIDALIEGQKAPEVEISAPDKQPSASPVAVAERAPQGVLPRKFAMQTLQPLYNSIEKTLSIFRKTGRRAEMTHREEAEEICITIRIPSKP